MKIRSLEMLALFVCCSGAAYACSSDEPAPVQSGNDASVGGTESGGAAGSGSGGKPSTGGKGSGGAGVASGGAQEAGLGGNADAEAGAAGGASGASSGGAAGSGTGGRGTGGGTGAGGADAGDGGCVATNALQCQSPYFKVPYPKENTHTDKKAMLGKILFWEEQMGELNTMACGTCHRSVAGGSDPRAATLAAQQPGPNGVFETQPDINSDDIRGAQGVPHCTFPADAGITDKTVQVTQRKPPSYFDAMFALGVFWDGRAGFCSSSGTVNGCFVDPDTSNVLIQGQLDTATQRNIGGALEAQSVGPPVSSVEMACSDQTWPRIHAKLATVVPLDKAQSVPADMRQFIVDHHNNYPEMFADVYGSTNKVNSSDPDNVINTRRIAFAIATHERRLTSNQTPWDKWNAGDNSAMTQKQIDGFRLFVTAARCQLCHTPPLFTDMAFHFIGFHDPTVNADASGLKKITNATGDMGKFKTPTLRNVGLREAGGLLHSGDGPGHDLPTVMGLYKAGGLRANSTILPLIDPQLQAVPITPTDIDAIIDFMRNALTDPRVQAELPPFDRPKLGTE